MGENQKMGIAALRFGVICDFVNGTQLEYGERERLLREKCARKRTILFSDRTYIGRATIQSRIKNYEDGNGNLESLCPRDLSDNGKSRTIDERRNRFSANTEHKKSQLQMIANEKIL